MGRQGSGAHLRGMTQPLLPVFYRPEMVAPAQGASPSAAKPAQLAEAWRQQRLPVAWHDFEPVTRLDLERAHDPAFVADVLACRRASGFGTRSPEVARSLPYTSGAMLAAARHALAHRAVACAPVSGFHHAQHGRAAGYCTFNGLVVTALALRAGGQARRVGILDADMHHGDGTEQIIAHLGLGGWIEHLSVGRDHERAGQAPGFLASLPGWLDRFVGCDVVLYQAGADPHIDDPLGGWLTDEQLARRDRIVFAGLRERGVPVAWNLAGGYQREADGSIPRVIAIHTRTAREALAQLERR